MKRRAGKLVQDDPAINPNRTGDLFAQTDEGYIIAQDIRCQYELIEGQRCSNCGGLLMPVAQLNRAFQGLNEVVTICAECSQRYSFIFDISNEVYQRWWADLMGENYVRLYDGKPRQPKRG